ncbi:MAG: hypothetical protein COT15_00890 [Candidatus Diapherotrites archaeon CG08_land_8_20_14_0_20_34_12]|nr:MAG: hypothetical protein COT15_00890 [Candidatus Diapherotrites archaeon CG08_land_8_20_14_0_20_34_12]
MDKITTVLKQKVHELCVVKAMKDKQSQQYVGQKFYNPIVALDGVQNQMTGEMANWVGGEKTRLFNVAEEVTSAENQDKQKDFIYQLTKLFGMQAQKEKEEATKLKEQTEKLTQSIESLKAIMEQVDDQKLKDTLNAQIVELEARKNELQQTVSNKEANMYGFFTALANIFGGGQ